MHEIANWKHLEVKRIRMGGNRLAKPKSTFDRVKSISNELTILFNYIHPYLNEICINYELKLQCCYFDVWVSFCAFYYHISIYRGLRVFRYEIEVREIIKGGFLLLWTQAPMLLFWRTCGSFFVHFIITYPFTKV